MKKLSRIDCGQPDAAVPSTDKWALLNTLTEAAEEFSLNHRTLSVLRALLSFFPNRTLPLEAGAAVVFPSNATLSRRLNGMPESTLRRHLATLVKTGIVSRQDSPNRKRFARRLGMAFGFDLSPLARAADTLHRTAAEARERRDRIAALRARLACVRGRLCDAGSLPVQHPVMEAARLTLRRKTGPEEIEALLDQLEPLLEDALPDTTHADDSIAYSIQNERHVQITKSESDVRKKKDRTSNDDPTLRTVLDTCNEYRSFFPETPATWHGVISAARKLSTMLGIGSATYDMAQGVLGTRKAAVTVLCILERMGSINCPRAYFFSLVARAEEGQFNFQAMLKRPVPLKLSADNFG